MPTAQLPWPDAGAAATSHARALELELDTLTRRGLEHRLRTVLEFQDRLVRLADELGAVVRGSSLEGPGSPPGVPASASMGAQAGAGVREGAGAGAGAPGGDLVGDPGSTGPGGRASGSHQQQEEERRDGAGNVDREEDNRVMIG
jgi:hypothetical protein